MYIASNTTAVTNNNTESSDYKLVFSLNIKKNANNRKADLDYDIELILYKLGYTK